MWITSAAHAMPTLLFLFAAISVADASEDLKDSSRCGLTLACAGCHGDQGAGSGPFPAINQLEPQQFISRMQSFRRGELPSTVMQRIAKGYSDPELANMANCFLEAP